MTKGTESTGKRESYLTFLMGGEQYAISVARVTELLEMVPVTKVPRIPEFMRGVINLRGEVVPVVDGRLKFGLQGAADTIDTCIVVMQIDKDGREMKIGVVVDHVTEVVEITTSEILPLPTVGGRERSASITGVIKLGDQITMVIDVTKEFESDLMDLDEQLLERALS